MKAFTLTYFNRSMLFCFFSFTTSLLGSSPEAAPSAQTIQREECLSLELDGLSCTTAATGLQYNVLAVMCFNEPDRLRYHMNLLARTLIPQTCLLGLSETSSLMSLFSLSQEGPKKLKPLKKHGRVSSLRNEIHKQRQMIELIVTLRHTTGTSTAKIQLPMQIFEKTQKKALVLLETHTDLDSLIGTSETSTATRGAHSTLKHCLRHIIPLPIVLLKKQASPISDAFDCVKLSSTSRENHTVQVLAKAVTYHKLHRTLCRLVKSLAPWASKKPKKRTIQPLELIKTVRQQQERIYQERANEFIFQLDFLCE